MCSENIVSFLIEFWISLLNNKKTVKVWDLTTVIFELDYVAKWEERYLLFFGGGGGMVNDIGRVTLQR